jgi:hypothetical protein
MLEHFSIHDYTLQTLNLQRSKAPHGGKARRDLVP